MFYFLFLRFGRTGDFFFGEAGIMSRPGGTPGDPFLLPLPCGLGGGGRAAFIIFARKTGATFVLLGLGFVVFPPFLSNFRTTAFTTCVRFELIFFAIDLNYFVFEVQNQKN